MTRRALLVLALACAACGDARAPSAPGAGSPFPPLTLPMLAGEGSIALPAPGEGPILVNVWATWCEPCRREMASLQRLHERGGRLRVVGISVDRDGNLAREFVRAHGISFANALDAASRLAGGVLAVRTLPTTFAIDASGVIRWREEGPRDWSDAATRERLRQALQPGAR